MELLDSNLLTVSISAILLVVIFGLRALNQTKRHQQWLFLSFLVGMGIGPLLLLSTSSTSFINSITLSSGNWRIIELGIASGLFWTVASTWLTSIKQLPSAALAVNVQWIKVAGFYLLLLAVIVISKNTEISAITLLTGAIGFGSIVLSSRQPRLLICAAISGVVFILLGTATAFIATYFSPVVGEYKIPFTSILLTLAPSSLVSMGMLALSSPILSRWWFSQPLGNNA